MAFLQLHEALKLFEAHLKKKIFFKLFLLYVKLLLFVQLEQTASEHQTMIREAPGQRTVSFSSKRMMK